MVAKNGERPGLLQALANAALFYLTVGATCSLILLFALFNRRKRTVHDVLSGDADGPRATGLQISRPASCQAAAAGREGKGKIKVSSLLPANIEFYGEVPDGCGQPCYRRDFSQIDIRR